MQIRKPAVQRINHDQIGVARPRGRSWFRCGRLRSACIGRGRIGRGFDAGFPRRLDAEARGGLLDAVFEDTEIGLLQVADVVARLIKHEDGHQHLPHVNANHRLVSGCRLLRRA